MLTPQEVQEITFVKAVFGGYDMQSVDAFLEPLLQDYETLYKENAVLKGKLKVLVQKLEELRSQEENVKQALLSTQKTCDSMVRDAEEKCRAMLADADARARDNNADALIAQEQQRLEYAKQTALNFISVIEQDVKGHLALLEDLKTRDLSTEEPAPAPHAAPASRDSAKDIADAIHGKMAEMGFAEEAPEAAPQEAEAPVREDRTSPTVKFENLQFGRNYDPHGK